MSFGAEPSPQSATNLSRMVSANWKVWRKLVQQVGALGIKPYACACWRYAMLVSRARASARRNQSTTQTVTNQKGRRPNVR